MSAVHPAAWPDSILTDAAAARDAVMGTIRNARHRLTLSLFRCTDQDIIAELGHAVERGVDVNVLVTSRSKGRKKLRKLWERLEATGAVVQPYSDPVVKYHAKYMVADDGPAVVMSLNFTKKCFSNSVDALAITFDPAVVHGLRRLYQCDCENRSSDATISDRLVIGPERARRQMAALIEGARSSIRIIDAKLSDPMFTRLLEDRRRDGIVVDVHTAKRLNGLRSHGKLMLIDNELAVVGGLALATLSLDFRREVALIVRHGSAVAALASLFDSVTAEPAPAPERSPDERLPDADIDPGRPVRPRRQASGP